MLFEPTTLTSTAKVIAETLQAHYALDPVTVFSKVDLDYEQLANPEARYPWTKMQALWKQATEMTGDPCFGLYAGRRVRATSFHALGYAWLSSHSLHGSLRRLCRYYQVISTIPIDLSIESKDDLYVFTGNLSNPDLIPVDPSIDAFFSAIVQLCRIASDENFAPTSIKMQRPDIGHIDQFIKILGCPVMFDAPENQIFFDKETLDNPLPGDNHELARANDVISERYLDTLDAGQVESEVRDLLVALLPSGVSDQKTIAQRMNRSLSTLQRQLHSEGTKFQDIRDDTRRQIAQDYVRDGELSLSQVAYLLGFSDQSNFSRAFKRWTNQSPREYRAGLS
jgi:AraC-like DNA-binding protein